ncbi:MAG: AAA family ATPase [Candidatus Freyarchaeota archaeon]|nr:AAA family ATPase [Candidatus Jordarchaeia archaeon]MBS7267954.1 AAA family ATPase [Candidatus Jordarchaeia archaeon]MBS7280354.1 AAA family ATPase [Candidatus Jordarchaeia archaeon]
MAPEKRKNNDYQRIPTNIPSLDNMLGGGIPFGVITHIFGASATGKTTLALQCTLNTLRKGMKTIYIDTEKGVHPSRILQMADSKDLLQALLIIRPQSFAEQSTLIDKMESFIVRGVKLIVLDTATRLYRVELGTLLKNVALNRELNRQMAVLLNLASNHNIAVIMTNQVSAVTQENGYQNKPAGGTILSYWSSLDLKMEHFEMGVRRITILKNFEDRTEKMINVLLTKKGLH